MLSASIKEKKKYITRHKSPLLYFPARVNHYNKQHIYKGVLLWKFGKEVGIKIKDQGTLSMVERN